MKMARNGLTLALAAVLVLGSQVLIPHASYAMGQNAQTDNNIQAQIQNDLKKFNENIAKVTKADVLRELQARQLHVVLVVAKVREPQEDRLSCVGLDQ